MKEREKSGGDKQIDKVVKEVYKMRKELANQGQHFEKVIEEAKYEAEKAKREKEKSDSEIERLKKELKEKMDASNKEYLAGIYQGKVKVKDPYYADEVKLEQKEINSLKPKRNENLVLQEYQPENYKDYEPNEAAIMRNDSEMMSLIGDSKKIPLDFESNETMSISKLEGYAKDTDYFKKNKKALPPSPLQKRYKVNDSIQEEDEDRMEDSRNERRGKGRDPPEELDMLLQSRKKSRGGWGEMSSVNEDMVNEIENMMDNKQQRPKSHLSSVGEKSLLTYHNEQLMANPKSTSRVIEMT